jgi:chemotaxis protein methyltransferase CheR
MRGSIYADAPGFHRGMEHFKYLAETLAPQLARRRAAGAEKELRGWSAGCSTGEEAYSIAITLLERPALSGPSCTIKLLGTDVSSEALSRAGRGEYSAESLEAAPSGLVWAYFDKTGEGGARVYRVKPRTRNLVHFRRFNPAREVFPFQRKFGFIFCRSAMIYSGKGAQGALVERFWAALEPGGALFIDPSESLTGLCHGFKYVKPGIYQKPDRGYPAKSGGAAE